MNTTAMNEPLKELSCQVTTSAHALLVCDGAGWHRPDRARQHHRAAPAALRAGTQPVGKCLGLSAGQQIKQPRLQHLQGNARCRQSSLEFHR